MRCLQTLLTSSNIKHLANDDIAKTSCIFFKCILRHIPCGNAPKISSSLSPTHPLSTVILLCTGLTCTLDFSHNHFSEFVEFCTLQWLCKTVNCHFICWQHAISNSPFLTWFVTMKCCTLIACIHLMLLAFPFFSNDVMLLLSWWMQFISVGCPCSTRNNGTHIYNGNNCPTATNAAVIKLSAFSFYFALTLIGHPHPQPNLTDTLVWLQKSGCVTKLTLMCHSNVLEPLFTSNVIVLFLVLCDHFMFLINQFQSFSVGFCALAHNTAIFIWISCLPYSLTNRFCATIWWNGSCCF